MATIIDPREELAALKSQLEKVRSEKAAKARAVASGAQGLDGELDRLQREENRLQAQIESVETFAGSEAAANLDARIAERHWQREADALRVLALSSSRICRARHIDKHRRALAIEIAALDAETAEMQELCSRNVDAATDHKRMDRYSAIGAALAIRAIADWKEAAGKVIGFFRGQATAFDREVADRGLAKLLTDRTPKMIEQLRREFPSLGDA